MSDNRVEGKEIVSISLQGEEIYALQIAIADQMALYEDISHLKQLDTETVEQAVHLRNVYRNALDKLDVNDEGLLKSWDDEVAKAKQPFNNVVDLESRRKDKEVSDELESE